jgi:hypothetical protein
MERRGASAAGALLCLLLLVCGEAFTPLRRLPRPTCRPGTEMSVAKASGATLDQRTPWQLSISLRRPGQSKLDVAVRVRFVEKGGYEPPQGRIFVESDSLGLLVTDEMGWAEGSWTLSEDKDDRRWGLWVQGLFEEPLYPYLYLSVGVKDAVVLASSQVEGVFGGEGVPGKRLYFRFNHVRNKGEVTLSDGQVTYKTVEMIKADPLGLGGMVNAGEIMPAGVVQIQPLLSPSS